MRKILYSSIQKIEVLLRDECDPDDDFMEFQHEFFALSFIRSFMNNPLDMKTLRDVFMEALPSEGISRFTDHEVLEQLAWQIASGNVKLLPHEQETLSVVPPGVPPIEPPPGVPPVEPPPGVPPNVPPPGVPPIEPPPVVPPTTPPGVPPIEPPPPLLIRVYDLEGKFIPRAPFKATLDVGITVEGQAGADGVVTIPLAAQAKRCVLKWGFEPETTDETSEFYETDETDEFVFESEIFLNVDEQSQSEQEEATQKLNNLGYPPEEGLSANVTAFQEDYGLAVTGQLDDQTLALIRKTHEECADDIYEDL